MPWDCRGEANLNEIFVQLSHTSSRVEVLLARHFPASGGCLYPDASGNVSVAEGGGMASDRPAPVYARCVAKLGSLVASFSAAAIEQAAIACIRSAKERTMFSCALDVVRHPRDPIQRQLFMARMMPQPELLHRQDDATAACIWLRLWTLHAWILELRLAIGLSGGFAGGSGAADARMLGTLDEALARLLRPDAFWLSVDLGRAEAGDMVARAPGDALAVGNLAWPSLLGALPPEIDLRRDALRSAGIGFRQEDGRAWMSLGGRFAEIPREIGSTPRARYETGLRT